VPALVAAVFAPRPQAIKHAHYPVHSLLVCEFLRFAMINRFGGRSPEACRTTDGYGQRGRGPNGLCDCVIACLCLVTAWGVCSIGVGIDSGDDEGSYMCGEVRICCERTAVVVGVGVFVSCIVCMFVCVVYALRRGSVWVCFVVCFDVCFVCLNVVSF
jgi:hypothetical protein